MPISPDDFPTPGQYIRALLTARGWDQRTLSHVLGLDYSSINRVILDRKPMTAFLAIALSDVFEVEADDFMELQKRFDLAVARASVRPDPRRAIRASVFGDLPVAEMIKRGWLDVANFKDLEKVEDALARFFDVEYIDKIPSLPHAAKKSEMGTEASPAQLAWLFRVRAMAATIQVPRYSPAAVREGLTALQGLVDSIDGIAKVPEILANSGIRFVIVESLPTAKIDGVCSWLNDFAPVIGMTLRHDRIDNFWFVLRHEIEHVLRGNGRRHAPVVDVELEKRGALASESEEERVANNAAADFCVPAREMEKFIAKKAPFFMERDVVGFAASVKRHPGLVVGQLQHRVSRFDRFRNHLVAVREWVLPRVVSDGWGSSFPVSFNKARA